MATDDVHDLLRELCRGITLQLLPATAAALGPPDPHLGHPKRGMIARDPDGLESLLPIVLREPVCAICGESTELASGVFRASVELEYEGVTIAKFAWAHDECFAKCIETGQQRGFPW